MKTRRAGLGWGGSFMLLAAAGCGAAQRGGGATGGGPANPGGASGTTGSAAGEARCEAPAVGPALSQRFDTMAQQVGPRGVRFRGIASAGFITRGTAVTQSFDVPANTCISIVALATAGVRDLDAHLFAPDGDVLVEDVEPDPHPTVQLCATEDRRVYYVLEAYDGEGGYAIGSFVAERQALEAVARAVGSRPGTALSTGATASEAEHRLQELRDGIVRRGFVINGDVVRASFAAAGALRFPVNVSADRCYTYAALADGEQVRDVDLSVYDADGDEVARDIRPERDAFVQLCPASTGTLSIEVRARPGPGVVLLQSFAADAAVVGGANTLWLGERLEWGASAVPLAQAVESTRQAMAAQGYGGQGPATTLTLAPGESRPVRVTLEGGHCTAVAAVIGRGLGRTRLEVHNPAGDFLARGAERGGVQIAVVCPAARQEAVVHVRNEVGSGDATVQTFTGPAAPAWAQGADPVAVSETLATQLATVQQGWHAEGSPERVRIGARSLRAREYDLPAGACTRLTLSAGGALPAVALTLRAASGEVLAQSSRDGTGVVTRCSPAAEHVRLEAGVDPPGAAEYDAFVARYARAQERPGQGH